MRSLFRPTVWLIIINHNLASWINDLFQLGFLSIFHVPGYCQINCPMWQRGSSSMIQHLSPSAYLYFNRQAIQETSIRPCLAHFHLCCQLMRSRYSRNNQICLTNTPMLISKYTWYLVNSCFPGSSVADVRSSRAILHFPLTLNPTLIQDVFPKPERAVHTFLAESRRLRATFYWCSDLVLAIKIQTPSR